MKGNIRKNKKSGKNYRYMSDNLKCVFQEYYRLAVLPVEDCRLLLAASYPLFETTTTEYDRRWREFQSKNSGIVLGGLKKGVVKRGKRITDHTKDEWTQTEKHKKGLLEQKVKFYGRKSIVTPWYNPKDDGFSSSQLLRIISLDRINSNPLQHHSVPHPYIGVSVVPVTLDDDHRKYKLLIIIDKQTALVSVQIFKRLGSKSITNEVADFVNALLKYNLRRKGIYFVDTGDSQITKMMNCSQSSLGLKFPKMVIDTYAKYNFKYRYDLQFDVSRTIFERELKTLLYQYNIGESRKRPSPYIQLKYRLKNRHQNNRIKINEETMPLYIHNILKLV